MKSLIEKLNESQLADYSVKTDGEFRRQIDKDLTHDNLKKINWEAETQYHNTYYHGKGKYGTRTIKMNNKKWHEINQSGS